MPPNNGSLPNAFQKNGTDCVIELDPVSTQQHYKTNQTANGTVPIGSRVEIRDLLRVTLLGPARYTLWLNPSIKQLRGVEQLEVTCSKCNMQYVNGTIWCYNHCWVPLTWFGVHQRFMCILDRKVRDDGLMAVYGITQEHLQLKQDGASSTINSLPQARSLKPPCDMAC